MNYDFIVIGGGISGASAADALAEYGKVALLEAENTPGYHSTGRSAALFTPHYGGATVRAINRFSRGFFDAPPAEFADKPLLSPPRGALAIAGPGLEAELDSILALSTAADPVTPMNAADAHALAPYMRPERIGAAAWEPGVMDIDVAALHQGFLRRLRKRGGEIVLSFQVAALTQADGLWTASSGKQSVSAPVVVNAAGAWADHVGALAGAKRIGLMPKRRTAIVVDMPEGIASATYPVVDFAGVAPYIKPETGRLMVSPGDETPVDPQDIQTDDFEIAVLVDWLERETSVKVRRIANSWAGLRSFVADQSPVVGFDSGPEGFFWLAGQGGFGIMMAPELARLSAELITERRFPDRYTGSGVDAAGLSPNRVQAAL